MSSFTSDVVKSSPFLSAIFRTGSGESRSPTAEYQATAEHRPKREHVHNGLLAHALADDGLVR
eukprot:3903445-Heterocapsa_arctica.AAC.1